MLKGRCECGGVRFELPAVRETITACHCSQCRRLSGHVWASTHAPFDTLRFVSDKTLTWYASSTWAKRGFCNACGSNLFYRMNDEDGIGIAAGCLEDTSGLTLSKQIFVKDKGLYYDIADSKPQIDTY